VPSPILHTGAGIALALLARRRPAAPDAPSPPPARTLAFHGFAVVVSSLPDLDYIPGLAIGQLNAFHQGPTHSLAAVTAAALVLAAVPPLRRLVGVPSAARLFAFVWLLLLVHLLLDLFTQDFRPPIGIPLFWPFADAPVHASFSPLLFPAWKKMALSDLFCAANLRPVLAETLSALLLLIPAFLLSRRATRAR